MDATGGRWGLRIAALGILCAAPGILLGQVTHGEKPQLPAPFATKSAGNPPEESKPAKGFLPTVPAGFKISVFATDFNEPRWLTVAPNGKDIFLADTHGGKIYILRLPASGDGPGQKEEFLTKLDEPFGIAFHENYIYVGDTDAVLRYKFDPVNSKILGEKEKIMDLPRRGHSTRAVTFGPDGKMYVSVGSQSNIDIESDTRRAAVTIADPDGKNARLFATGLRNPVDIAFEPKTGVLFTSVNERDGLGDDLPPDYFTSVKDGGFYGWPYSYIGKNVDPRVNPQKPELVAKAIIPDVLLGAHRAPLQFTFYTGKQFPAKYDGGVFLCEHGSWNRSTRAGYQVVFIPFKNGEPSGDPEPFMTGLVPDPSKGNVNGRPVGVTVAPDGSLLVSDDGAQVVYRITAD
jgi:glucose/arabinose dehydrogenase